MKRDSRDVSIKYNVWILLGSQFEHTNYKKTFLRQSEDELVFKGILY